MPLSPEFRARLVFTGCLLLLTGPGRGQQQPAAGTGLRGQYYAGQNFEKLVLTRPDQAIDFNWTTGRSAPGQEPERFVSPGPGVPAEYFSVRWTGYVYAPISGLYTFQIATDDGMRVWVGGRKVLDSWEDQRVTRHSASRQLTAGRYYSLRVEYYQVRWDSRALLAWQLPAAPLTAAPALEPNLDRSIPEPPPIPVRYLYPALPASARPLTTPSPASKPGGTIRIVPGARRAPAIATPVKPSAGMTVAGTLPAGIGLLASYHAGAVQGPVAHQRVEPVVDVTWRGAAPAPGVPGQGFSVRWTGYVRAPESGLYVFHTEWDDATDIRFAGESILEMEKYEPEYFLPRKPPIPVDIVQNLTAGHFYRIDLAYKNIRGVSRAVLSWARPSTLNNPATLEQAFAEAEGRRLTIVPQQFLYPELPQPLFEPVVSVVAARPPVPRPATVKPVVARPKPAAAPPVRPAPQPTPPIDTLPALPDFRSLTRGTAVTLPNLYFTQSTASLLLTSRSTLNSLARTLRTLPSLRLEIAGHTDNIGDPAPNQRLSELRARLVRQYLVQQGIDSTRLVARGYGGTRPVADNHDPRQRARNRRVEVVVQ